jgi:ketol-acid reductoisomerase
MSLPVYHESDCDLADLAGRKIAVLGFGNQGHAHALNLRDSGLEVVVAQRPGSVHHEQAAAEGFELISPEQAARGADMLIFCLPDEAVGQIYREHLAGDIRDGQTLGFVHGYAIRFGHVVPPAGVDVIMVAPKGPGVLLRSRYVEGKGLPCLLAVHQDATGRAMQTALAWGRGIGGARAGLLETTFAHEAEADLFGEQAVLCGGMVELARAAFDTLVAAGFPPEVAYFECVHEIKQIVDLLYAGGLRLTYEKISNTARFGALTRGPRMVTDDTRRAMKRVLEQIQSGQFAEQWVADHAAGLAQLRQLTAQSERHPMEQAGELIRRMTL